MKRATTLIHKISSSTLFSLLLLSSSVLIATQAFGVETLVKQSINVGHSGESDVISFFDREAQNSGRKIVTSVDTSDFTIIKKAAAKSNTGSKNGTLAFANYTKRTLLQRDSLFVLAPIRIKTDNIVESHDNVSSMAFELITMLTEAQVNKMYQKPLVTTQWLDDEQRPLYAQFLRNSILKDVTDLPKPIPQMSNKEILDFPISFLFAHTLEFQVVKNDGDPTDWIGVFDFGRGALKSTLAMQPRASQSKLAGLRISPKLLTARLNTCDSPRNTKKSITASTPTIKFFEVDETKIFSVDEIFKVLQKHSQKEIKIDRNIQKSSNRILCTKGQYSVSELILAASQALGAEPRELGSLIFVAPIQSDQRTSKITLAKSILDRVESGSIPREFQTIKRNERVPFKSLTVEQQNFIVNRLQAELDPGLIFDMKDTYIVVQDNLWYQAVHNSKDGTFIQTFAWHIL